MNFRKWVAVLLFSLNFWVQGSAPVRAGELLVNVIELRSGEGVVRFGLFNDPKTFGDKKGTLVGVQIPAQKSGVEYLFKDLQPGQYAVAVYHDENNNGDFDIRKMMFIIPLPLEGFGFTRDPSILMGKPDFEDAALTVGSDRTRAQIRMKYIIE